MNSKNTETHALIIAYDVSHDTDNCVLIIGRMGSRSGEIDIVNAFQGDEARELYNNLITKKEINK